MVACHAAVGAQGQGRCRWHGCVERKGQRAAIGAGVAGQVGLAHQHTLVAVAVEDEAAARAGSPAAAAADLVFPAGAGLQANDIDLAVDGLSVTVAAAAVSGQGQRWRGDTAVAREAVAGFGADIAGGIGLTHQHALGAIATEDEAVARAGGPAAAAADLVFPAGAGLQANDIDRAGLGHAVVVVAAGVALQGQYRHRRRGGVDGDADAVVGVCAIGVLVARGVAERGAGDADRGRCAAVGGGREGGAVAAAAAREVAERAATDGHVRFGKVTDRFRQREADGCSFAGLERGLVAADGDGWH